MRRRLNRLFRTKANHNVIKQGWKFRMYMRLVRLTDESKKMIDKFLSDIEMEIPDIEIDQIIQKSKSQRAVMSDVIQHIAERLEVEDENS